MDCRTQPANCRHEHTGLLIRELASPINSELRGLEEGGTRGNISLKLGLEAQIALDSQKRKNFCWELHKDKDMPVCGRERSYRQTYLLQRKGGTL